MDCRRSCQEHSHIELKTPNIKTDEVLEKMSVWLQNVGKCVFRGGDINLNFMIIFIPILEDFPFVELSLLVKYKNLRNMIYIILYLLCTGTF